MKKALYSLIVLCGFVLCGCSNGKSSQNNVILSREFLNSNWERFDFVTNTISIDKETCFDLAMDISFTEQYPYKDFTMVFTVFDSEGTPYRSKEYKFKLKDLDGNWNSEKAGDCYTYSLPINNELWLTEPGAYTFQVEYRMPITPIVGVKTLKLYKK